LIEETDSEDEEIVFVGRNGTMSDERKALAKEKEEETLKKDKLVFQSLVDDHGASFGYVCEQSEPAVGASLVATCFPHLCRTLTNITSLSQPLFGPRHRDLLRPQDMVSQHDGRPTGSVRWSERGSGDEKAQPCQERAS
jgi:hypothetical protein